MDAVLLDPSPVVFAGRFSGAGFFAGELPTSAHEDSPDGRFKILNEPARGRVVVFDRRSLVPVRSTLAASDGTWRLIDLNPSRDYVVAGFDDRGLVNAAIQDWVRPHVPEP